MKTAGGILGLIGGLLGVSAALFTLFFGGLATAFHASGASTVVGLGWGGLGFSFLTIILGAVSLSATSKWPGAMLIASSILGAVLGGTVVAICMILALVGGILAMVGAKPEPGSVAAQGQPSKSGKAWLAVGGVAAFALIAGIAALSGKSGSTVTPSAVDAKTSPTTSPAPVPAPQFKVGDAFQGKTFRAKVTTAKVAASVGDGFMQSTPAAGAEYVAIAWSYTNISSAPVDADQVPQVKLIDPAGHVYDRDLDASAAFAAQINSDAKVLSDVNPGISITDGDAFEVSQALFDPNTWKIRVTSQDGVVEVAFASPAVASPPVASSPVPAAQAAASHAPASAPVQAASAPVMEGQEIAIPGTILFGQDKFAVGVYTYFRADTPFVSPCDDSKVQEVLLWNPTVGDPQILKAFAGRHVTLHGEINCPMSGIQFSPDSPDQP